MTFDITKYKRTSEYNKYLDSIDYNTSCIEQCVSDIEEKFTKYQEESKPIRTVIYGDPQSGKTSMMIGLCAKFIDLRYKLIVILIQDNDTLLEQNLERFQNSSLNPEPNTFQNVIGVDIKINSRERIIICKKNTHNLEKLNNKIAKEPNKIIIDDEADYASPNSKINKGDITKINERINSLLNNDGHYIGVTATPARLDVNNTFLNDSREWVLFKSHENYTGMDTFFPVNEAFKFNLKYLPEETTNEKKEVEEAVIKFIVRASFLNINKFKEKPKNWIMLIHTSHLKIMHQEEHEIVNDILSLFHMGDEKFLEKIYNKALKLYNNDEAIADDITDFAYNNRGRAPIGVLNHEKKKESGNITRFTTDPTSPFTFVIGGNIISRGLTFNNLLVMFFTRTIKTIMQQDTYIQRARMFGSRGDYLSEFELFITEELYTWWWTAFYLFRLSKTGIPNNEVPIWAQGMKTRICAPSSMDKNFVSYEKGEMAGNKLKYKIDIEELLPPNEYTISEFKSRIEKINTIVDGNVISKYILDAMHAEDKDNNHKVAVLKTLDIESQKSADHYDISRATGMISGGMIKSHSESQHIFRIYKNKDNYFRAYYKVIANSKTWLKNTKNIIV